MSKKEKEPSEVLADFLNYIDKCRHDYQAAHDAVGMEDKRLQDLLHGLEFAAAEYEDTGLTPEQIRELKERDMPKKIEINAGVPTCPVCGRRIVKCYDFCPDCGQRLEQ